MTERRADAPGAGRAPAIDMALLGIYLNDHLAGATAGTARVRYLLRSCRGTALGDALAPVAAEIAEDRASLLHIMRRLDVAVRRYKVYAGRAAEQVGRLKSNGSLVRRSPLSTLWELEALVLGVTGKAAGWETLRELAPALERLDARQLDDLTERARRQRATLEGLRRKQAEVAFLET
ncbi:conserved hypothetical protein [Streptomyces viridochromogenes DSM 40736]|uniref:Uncharacterized protein n=1 Tax=Streptomyces viridochromogenes (strain DSM 40736 / JCM 4977 / BCRC 1201 / Tue 494) TaxID=591159 RepID=D9X4R1_STRVT|nr:hypothetical protein [Streptomyces viridochromogenes]EFL29720.1 conserved hypothetical protein [Streptomyces viridochromogenes DSM 40736]